jgi:hypothetical protein
MDIQTRAPLYAWIAVIVAALSVVTTSQEQSTASAHYTVFTRDGSEVDLGFARKWLDAAEQLMATKYHVVPDRYHTSVYLLHRPENDVDTTQSGQNRCCATDSQDRKNGNDLSARSIRPCVEGAAASLKFGASERRCGLPRESPHV